MSNPGHKKPSASGWVKLLRDVPAAVLSSQVQVQSQPTKARNDLDDESELPWKTIDDELIDDTVERLSDYANSSTDSSNNSLNNSNTNISLDTRTNTRQNSSINNLYSRSNAHPRVFTSSSETNSNSNITSTSGSDSSSTTSSSTSSSTTSGSSSSSSSTSSSDRSSSSIIDNGSSSSSHKSMMLLQRQQQYTMVPLQEEPDDQGEHEQIDDLDERTTVSLTVSDAVRPRRSSFKFRRSSSSSQQQQHVQARNAPSTSSAAAAAAATALLDAGTIWSTIDGVMDGDAAGMSTSNESSLNYSEVSDITLFSTTTPAASFPIASTASTVSTAAAETAAAIARPTQSQEQQIRKGDRGNTYESKGGNQSDQSSNVVNANDDEVGKHTTIHASFRIESGSTPSPETDMEDSGETTGDKTDLTTTPSPENSSVRDADPLPPVAPPKMHPAEEGGFLAFLAQMRQVVEQPVDTALREFVPSDVAESARPAPPPEFTGDDAETIMARNEGNAFRNDRQLGPGRLSSKMDLSTRGGSMHWMFSIPPVASPSNDPLLSNRDKSKPPDFREIPLSYSPSAPMQPWGPNTSDLWTSTTRLLAAIPEEVASVMSTASMSLSFAKNRPPGSVDGDPKSGSKMKSILAIAILITLVVAAAGLVFVVMAIIGSARTTLLTTAMPMPPIAPPAPSAMILSSSAPSVTPSFRGQGVPLLPPHLPTPPFAAHPTPAGSQPSPFDGPMPATTGNHTVHPFPTIPRLSTAPTSEPPGSSYGVATEHPSSAPYDHGTVPAPGDEGFGSEIPSSITDIPTSYPSFHVPIMTSQAPVNESTPPWYSELIAELHPSSEPSTVSKAPSVEDLPPWYLDIIDKRSPSSEPSADATFPLQTASPSLRSTRTSRPSLRDQQDFLDTEMPTVTSGQVPTAFPSEKRTPLTEDTTTAMPTRVLDYGFQWKSNGEIQGNVGFRSVKMSEAGNRVAVATSSQVQVFERTSDDGPWQQFGSAIESPGIQAVSISGDGNTIAHGAFSDGIDRGSVRVDRWDGKAWTRIGSELPGSCPYPGCMELSREGSIIAVGNPLENSYAGSVTVFMYDEVSQEWQLRGDPISGEIPGDMAGTSVSLSSDGSLLAMGSPGRTIGDQISIGQAAIFKFSPTNGWTKVGQSLGGFEQLKQFGFSITLSGNGTRVAISAPFVDYHGDLRGMVYVYEVSTLDGMWEPLGRPIQGLYLADNAGTSIALSSNGRTLAVGAPRRGYVQILVFDQEEEGWIQIGFVESEEDQFGSSVTMSSDGRTVGACGTSLFGNGMVELFRRADDLPRQSLHLCDDNRNAAMSADC